MLIFFNLNLKNKLLSESKKEVLYINFLEQTLNILNPVQ